MTRRINFYLTLALFLYSTSLNAAPAFLEAATAAKSQLLDSYWTQHKSNSELTIDHSLWDSVLAGYVVEHPTAVNLFDYAAVSMEKAEQIKTYIHQLASLSMADYNQTEQHAYWLNLYNALTVSTILDHYPVGSIRQVDISPGLFASGLFSSGPWRKKLVTVHGSKLSLNDIEHGIIRPVYKDPRSHYGANCAALGCPQIQPSAFTGENLDVMLDQAARDYINGHGATIHKAQLETSSIYNWFALDFGDSKQDVLDHISNYAQGELKKLLENIDVIKSYYYDWDLNDAALLELEGTQ